MEFAPHHVQWASPLIHKLISVVGLEEGVLPKRLRFARRASLPAGRCAWSEAQPTQNT